MKNFWVSSIVLSVLLVISTSWKINEDDVFWLLRFGEELLKTHQIPRVDSWSFTVFGEPWVNHGWLTSVVLYIVFGLGGFKGLVVLRSFLILSWFLVFSWILKHQFEKKQGFSNLLGIGLPLLFLSLGFLCLNYRFQLRGESFGLLLYLLVLKIGFQKTSLKKEDYKNFRNVVFLLLLWSNLHSGSLVFGILAAAVFFSRKVKWYELLLLPVTLILNPYGIKSVSEIIKHANYPQHLLWNLEWQPVSIYHFNFLQHGFSILTWTVVIAFISAFLFATATRKNADLLILFCIFAFIGFKHIRAFPYAFFLGVPLFWSSFFESQAAVRVLKQKQVFIVALSGLFFLISIFEIQKNLKLVGLGLFEEAYAVALIKKVQDLKPAGNLFADGMPANYQLWAARDYPVFYDARDVLYNQIKIEYQEAFLSAGNMNALRKKYGITSMIVNKNELGDRISVLFPAQEWSKVQSQGVFELFIKNGK